MKIVIDSKIHIMGAPVDVRNSIMNNLTIKNPQYAKMSAMGLPVWNVPKVIKLYEQYKDMLIIPRGYGSRLKQLLSDKDVEYENHTLILPEVEFHSTIKLRDYQSNAVEEIKQRKSGVIIMPCGAGKTITGLEAIAQLGQPTLWLTHTKDLLNQSLKEAKDKLGLKKGEYGVIGSGEFSIGTHITFATVQTLANRDLGDLKDRFGCVVIDEAHRCFKNHKSTGQFQKIVSELPARYRIGLTASEHRSDGLIETMFLTIAPKVYEVTQETMRANGNVITPEIRFITTPFEYVSDSDILNFAQLLKEMAEDDARNEIILNCLRHHQKGDHSLVLGDSLEHLEMLKDRTVQLQAGYRVEFIYGGTPKRQREKILQDMRNGKVDYLFATYALAKEGLDIPCLNRLYLLTPKRDKVVIQQSVGRIMRPAPGKEKAIVYDFYDINIRTCVQQARARIKDVYTHLGCSIVGGPTVRNSLSLSMQTMCASL